VRDGSKSALLGDEAEERRQRGHARGRADSDDQQRPAALPEPGHPADIAGAGGVIDDADDHERDALNIACAHSMASPASNQIAAARANHHRDQPELADRAERQNQFQVVFAHRAPAGQQHREHAEYHHRGRQGGESAIRDHARDEIERRLDHRRGVQVRADRIGAAIAPGSQKCIGTIADFEQRAYEHQHTRPMPRDPLAARRSVRTTDRCRHIAEHDDADQHGQPAERRHQQRCVAALRLVARSA